MKLVSKGDSLGLKLWKVVGDTFHPQGGTGAPERRCGLKGYVVLLLGCNECSALGGKAAAMGFGKRGALWHSCRV